ncbi:MAG: aminomethyl-transferring glycine dehydrogenase [Bacteroidota bacterium]|nr:aminomethyl-transferring glycine dehydrogenase [Bacteroidota bacterium]
MDPNTLIEESFAHRHIGPREAEKDAMLAACGVRTLDELIEETVPAHIRQAAPPDLPPPMSERRMLEHLAALAAQNERYATYIGIGWYGTITPSVILRNILENPGWYTQYTPYQAEIAQGRLEAMLNFQTMVSDLTGMEIANASLLDEGTSAAEAMIMLAGIAHRKSDRAGARKFFVSDTCFPQTIDVLKTRSAPLGIELVIGDERTVELDHSFFGAIIQYPAQDGAVRDPRAFIQRAHEHGVLTVVATDLLALVDLVPPGEIGADVAIGSAQRFGVPMGYGGPHAGFFATRREYIRQMPGRIIGVSIDAQGRTAFRMTLQTREQHIKREKATSNICTSQALLAVMAGMYAVYHGPDGLRRIARNVHLLALALERALRRLGYEQENAVFFDTLRVRVPDAEAIRERAEKACMNFRIVDATHIGISLDETCDEGDVRRIAAVFADAAGKETGPLADLFEGLRDEYPLELRRRGDILTHPVFRLYHSETEMLRYIKRLENRDLSLAHSMISLGSCTMKLNPTTAMEPITWPAFTELHPFVPEAQAAGYRAMFRELEDMLCAVTGLSACSLQPNSGAQGEYTGLMVIRAYQHGRGETRRNVALIPASAHGTNPASAVMAGCRVVVVACDAGGNIDVDDLRRKAEEHANELLALMVTYPSTHGVFEERISEICRIVHEHGGQVYMDGANLNAQVGLTNPGLIGADVCHINLHKTFAIPHGGGGPGMGPICVAAHLAPYLPGHPVVRVGGEKAITAVASAPWGSASILPISYAYMKMLGPEGLTEVSEAAILNANYLKSRLEPYYPILYTGKNGRVAHEFILDLRPFKSAGIEAEDVAKRLMDYNFHAPTVSFPVPGTLMIEPTESESKAELDRFIDAMIAIRGEIQDVIDGKADPEDNVLHNAPHTAREAVRDDWQHPYTRRQAVFPLPYVAFNKFWPAVGRVNNSYGDRNLVCTCPPAETYLEIAQGEAEK